MKGYFVQLINIWENPVEIGKRQKTIQKNYYYFTIMYCLLWMSHLYRPFLYIYRFLYVRTHKLCQQLSTCFFVFSPRVSQFHYKFANHSGKLSTCQIPILLTFGKTFVYIKYYLYTWFFGFLSSPSDKFPEIP